MTTTYADVKKLYGTEAAAQALAIPKQGWYGSDTRRLGVMESDGVTARYYWDSTRMADTTSTYGAALIGSAGITGITPNGGSSGGVATLANMLIGIRDSTVLKSPYGSTVNVIQPVADYIALRIRGYASQTADLQRWETSAGTALAYINSIGALTISSSQSGSLGITLANTNNAAGGAHAALVLSAGGGSGGDPLVQFSVSGAQTWVAGIDNSDSDSFKISASSSLGSSDYLTISTAGAVGIAGSFTLTSTQAEAFLISTTANNPSYIRFTANSTSAYIAKEGAVGTDFIAGGTAGALQLVTATNVPVQVGVQGVLIADFTSTGLSITGAASVSSNLLLTNGSASTISQNGGGYLVISTSSNNIYLDPADDLFIRPGGALAVRVLEVASASRYITMAGSNGGNPQIGVSAGALEFISDISVKATAAAGTTTANVENADNTNTASHSWVTVKTGGSSAGDPMVGFTVTGVTNWTMGIDNSDSDKFKISASTALGTSDALVITTAGAVSIPNLTDGRIPVIGASGLLAVDNLYWDATNDWMGIGSAASTPESVLHLTREGTCNIILQRADSASSAGPGIQFRKARGTHASPTVVTPDDMTGKLLGQGWHGSAHADMAYIGFYTGAGSFTSGQRPPSYIAMHTNAANGSQTEALRIDENQLVIANAGFKVGAGALTLSALSAGRIPVVSTSGLIIQDNLYWDATNDRMGIGSGAASPTYDLQVDKSDAGMVGAAFRNTDNSSSVAHARLYLITGGASGGDPCVTMTITGAESWSVGIDNSDSDSFKITNDISPGGANDALVIDTALAATFKGSLYVEAGYVRLPNLASAPGSPANGMMYYNTGSGHACVYTSGGGGWVEFG